MRRRWSEANSFGRPNATFSHSSYGWGRRVRGSCNGRKPRSESSLGAVVKVDIHNLPCPAWWSSVCQCKPWALGYLQDIASDTSPAIVALAVVFVFATTAKTKGPKLWIPRVHSASQQIADRTIGARKTLLLGRRITTCEAGLYPTPQLHGLSALPIQRMRNTRVRPCPP
jgi:hypothetical protein